MSTLELTLLTIPVVMPPAAAWIVAREAARRAERERQYWERVTAWLRERQARKEDGGDGK